MDKKDEITGAEAPATTEAQPAPAAAKPAAKPAVRWPGARPPSHGGAKFPQPVQGRKMIGRGSSRGR